MRNDRKRWLGILAIAGTVLWSSPWLIPTGWGQETPPEVEQPENQGDEAPPDEGVAPSQEEATPSPPEEETSPPQEEPATASPEEPATPPEEETEPMEESPPAAPESLAVPAPGPGMATHKYTVKKGDTLWDISNTYMRDSFLWPKLWKTNQYILNPDLIYPGNVINLPGEEALKQAALVEAEKPMPMPPPRVVEEKAPVEPELPVETEAPVEAPPRVKPFGKTLLAESGYIITREKSAGIVVGAQDDRELIGESQTAYLLPRGAQPQVGDQYTIYRITRKVYHPVTGKYMGDLIRILGLAEVTGADPREKTVTSKILVSYDTIYQGDFLMTPQESAELTEGGPPSASPSGSLQGVIVDVKADRASQAQYDVVYLDRGRQDGVHSGDRFAVVRAGNKTSLFSAGRGVRLPQRTIGELEVIAVQDTTATAQIVQSTEVIYRGDRYETHGPP